MITRLIEFRQSDCEVKTTQGHVSKVLRTEKAGREHGVPPTASKLEAVPSPRKGSREGESGRKKRIVDRPAVNAEGKAYLLVRDVVIGAPELMDWERVDVLHFIDLGIYLDAERFVYSL